MYVVCRCPDGYHHVWSLCCFFVGARNETSKMTPSGLRILYYSNLIKGLQVFFQGICWFGRRKSLFTLTCFDSNQLYLANFSSIRTDSCSVEMSSSLVLYNKPCRSGIATRLGAGRCGVYIPAVERDSNFFFFQNISSSSGTRPISCSIDVGVSLPGRKVAAAWAWPLNTSSPNVNECICTPPPPAPLLYFQGSAKTILHF